MGPLFFVDDTLISKNYVDLFCEPSFDFLDDHVSLADLTKMSFQHDGLPTQKVAPSRTCVAYFKIT